MKRSPLRRRKTHLRRSPFKRRRKRTRYARRERDYDYMAFVRSLPCCMCGALQSEAHHAGERAFGRRAPDRTCVALCRRCHESVGKLGRFRDKADRRAFFDDVIAETQSRYLARDGRL